MFKPIPKYCNVWCKGILRISQWGDTGPSWPSCYTVSGNVSQVACTWWSKTIPICHLRLIYAMCKSSCISCINMFHVCRCIKLPVHRPWHIYLFNNLLSFQFTDHGSFIYLIIYLWCYFRFVCLPGDVSHTWWFYIQAFAVSDKISSILFSLIIMVLYRYVFGNIKLDYGEPSFPAVALFPIFWFEWCYRFNQQSNWRNLNSFLTVDNIRSFYGLCRSRSDCTECAVWYLIYTVHIFILDYNWNVYSSSNGGVF